MTKARTNASASPAVGRNMIINGAMNVAQRATSVTGIGASEGYFTCDRWHTRVGSTAGRFTMSQASDGPNGISANCLKLDCTTADTSIAAAERLWLRYLFEGQDLQRMGKGVVGAKQVNVSFYVKANAAFTFGLELFDNDNDRQITKLFDTTTDWVRHEITFPADVDDGSSPFDDTNGVGLILAFLLHGGATYTGGTLNTAAWANNTNANRSVGIDSFFSSTDNNFFITGVQMEVGPVATEFEQEDFGVTLTKCQRYFRRLPTDQDATAYARIGNGFLYDTASAFITIPLSPPMRTSAAAAINGTLKIQVAANADCTVTGVAATTANNSRTAFYGDFTCDNNGTAGQGCGLNRENDVDASLDLSAEL